MELKIGEKNYELRFGLSFIREMDMLYTQSMSGVSLGIGLQMMDIYLEIRLVTALANVIKAGISHLNTKPSNDDIEEYLADIFVKEEQEKLFKEVEVATEQAPFLKPTIKGLKQESNQAKKPTKK